MSNLLTPQSRVLLDAPYRQDRPVEMLGRALWLYVHLVLEADHHGRVIRHVDKIVSALAVPVPDMETWLARLVETRLVEVLSPSPFLVIKLALWSGHGSQQSLPQGDLEDSSSSKALGNNYQGEKGGQGEGEGLLREILDTLGETDPTSFEGAVRNYPPQTIRDALERVRRARSIRKNRTALFRYLLANRH